MGFRYDSGQDQPLTSGRFAAPERIIGEAGGTGVMHDPAGSWTAVGRETVVERDPEVIVICDCGDVSAEQKEDFLPFYAPLREVSAAQHRRIVVLDSVDLVESPRSPSAMRPPADGGGRRPTARRLRSGGARRAPRRRAGRGRCPAPTAAAGARRSGRCGPRARPTPRHGG